MIVLWVNSVSHYTVLNGLHTHIYSQDHAGSEVNADMEIMEHGKKLRISKSHLVNMPDDKGMDEEPVVVCDPRIATSAADTAADAAADDDKDVVGILTCKEWEYCFATSEMEGICVPIEVSLFHCVMFLLCHILETI